MKSFWTSLKEGARREFFRAPLLYSFGWIFLIYMIIARYCAFKHAMGWATTACSCG